MGLKKISVSLFLVFLLSLTLVSAVISTIDQERQQSLGFNHLLYISDINTNPSELYPGEPGTLNFKLENTGSQYIKDVRISLTLPAELAPSNDISKRKIASMDSGEVAAVSFNILALPNTEDGVYKVPVTIDYLNWIGDARQESETMSILVGSSPKLLLELSSTDIYKGNLIGTVKIKVINDNPGNVKFLKVQLNPSEDYEIIGSDLDYVGDLDSDDFSDSSFKINVDRGVEILDLPLTISYKDGLNQDYNEARIVSFKIPTATEAGVQASYTWLYMIILVLAVGGFIAYRKYNKNLAKAKKAASLSFNTKF